MDNKILGSIILEGAATVEDVIVSNDSKDDGKVIAEGTLQDMDVENRNHRIYARKDLEPEINGPRMKELINKLELTGECGHPLSDSIVRQQTIDPKLECVRYLKVWTEGNLVKGQFKGTNNDLGEAFDKDLRTGVKPAFSLRALGSIENVNGKAYVRGVKIITWDRVHFPSHKVAYTEKLITESAGISVDESANEIYVTKDDPGRIINITGSDAMNVLNKLQRESASMSMILETFDKISESVTLEKNKVVLTNRFGDRFLLPLDAYVENVIMDYVYKF